MFSDRPILYSFRRCPYAIRARLAIRKSGISVVLREVLLKEKPDEMLRVSAKATVPVLVIENSDKAMTVIDESLDIMRWALSFSDPDKWLPMQGGEEIIQLIEQNDFEFKPSLDRYKYFERYPERTQDQYLDEAMHFLERLEENLGNNNFLVTNAITLADVAIFPFIRQFAMVDRSRFESLPLPKLQNWLEFWLSQPLFIDSMAKYPQWQAGSKPVLFG